MYEIVCVVSVFSHLLQDLPHGQDLIFRFGNLFNSFRLSLRRAGQGDPEGSGKIFYHFSRENSCLFSAHICKTSIGAPSQAQARFIQAKLKSAHIDIDGIVS